MADKKKDEKELTNEGNSKITEEKNTSIKEPKKDNDKINEEKEQSKDKKNDDEKKHDEDINNEEAKIDEKDVKINDEKKHDEDVKHEEKKSDDEKDVDLNNKNAEKSENKSSFKVVKPNEAETKTKENSKNDKKIKDKSKKKKGKGGKVFCVILLLIILAIVIHFLKNQLIFTKIMNTAQNYTSSQNYEIIRATTEDNKTNKIDSYYLNGAYKVIFTQSSGTKLTIVAMKNKVAIFTEKNNDKTVKFVEKDKVDLDAFIGIENRTITSNSFWDNMCSIIIEKNEDGKDYYVIKGKSSNFLIQKGYDAEVYINKETGLIEKIIEHNEEDANKENENNEKSDEDKESSKTTTYEYKFNSVKQSDISISDISSYEIID